MMLVRPGTWHDSDSTGQVVWSDALAAWVDATEPILEGVAATFGNSITYDQLAQQLFERTSSLGCCSETGSVRYWNQSQHEPLRRAGPRYRRSSYAPRPAASAMATSITRTDPASTRSKSGSEQRPWIGSPAIGPTATASLPTLSHK